MKSELAAVRKSNVSRVKWSPGPALPGAGSRTHLPSLRRGMNAESNLLLCLTEEPHRQRFLPVTSTGVSCKDT